MKSGMFLLSVLAAIGFVLSVCVHVAAVCGVVPPIGQAVWLLHIGIFVVWFPTVLIARRVSRAEHRKDVWKMLWAGCPRWMRWVWYVLVPYVALNFIYFVATSSGHHQPRDLAATLRAFSGHWMIFYGAAFMTLYSVTHRPEFLRPRTCLRGHAVSITDQFCSICGESLPS